MKVEIIGFDSGWGCADYGCEDGPGAVPMDRVLHKLRHHQIDAKWRGLLGLKPLGRHDELNTKEKTLPLVLEAVRRLSNHVKHAVENNVVPIVIGGDHSSAIGTWSGVVAGLKTHQKFGLIWLDAHLDSHTNETAHQGKWGGWWHGQPVSALLGQGLPDLKNTGGIATKLAAEHISLIGMHSFEPGEEEFVKKNNIRVYYLDEVEKRGFKACYDEALERATKGTDGFGLTIDLDAFHPDEAPGVGSQESRGLHGAEVLPIIKAVARHPMFKALEIAEYNPHRDKKHITRDLIEKIIGNVFAQA